MKNRLVVKCGFIKVAYISSKKIKLNVTNNK